MRWTAALILLLAACSRQAEPQANEMAPAEAEPANAVSPVPESPTAQAPAVAAADRRSPEAAVAVLNEYFRLIAAKDYAGAWRLWSDAGRASGMSEAEFAASFATYREYRGAVGSPGAIEGAAGSSYLTVPVDVTGQLRTGERFKQSGSMMLRRVNDVPGATPEQLQWRIHSAELKPAAD
jgi:hypothetical protein